MSNSLSLFPKSLSLVLSTDSAIEEILADIPLFCEGIMGIGVFTFLFLTKQVKLISVFLYAATFTAFIAATLDLSQVISRGPQDTADGIGLQSVTALIYAREICLAISVFFLDLFFWVLVARCPRTECKNEPSEVSTRRNSAERPHSASWRRWGVMGAALKWCTLAALISVPLLQMVWRLIPNQRKYTPVYVAESTIQTSVTAIFILKFILNIIISPLDNWWKALQLYSVPMAALVIGVGIGIGNLAVFAFAETSLGRFLRGIEVYLLIVHSLYTIFEEFSDKCQKNKVEQPQLSEKAAELNYIGGLPFAYAPTSPGKIAPDVFLSPSNVQSRRTSTISWVLPSPLQRKVAPPARTSLGADSVVLARYTPPPSQNISSGKNSPKLSPFQPVTRERLSKDQQEDGRQGLGSVARPLTSLSLSYYTMDQNFSETNKDITRPSDLQATGTGSNQASITSLDELFRQQTELDRSIAALRLNSTLLSNGPSFTDNQVFLDSKDRSRATLVSTKTESLSNRSEFSLSVFPDPPNEQKEDVATKYIAEPSRSQDLGKAKGRSGEQDMLTAQNQRLGVGKTLRTPTSQQAQFDVTSIIRDLSDSSRNSLDSVDVKVDAPGIAETPAAAIQTTGLRPMILPLRISTTQKDETSASPTSIPRSYNNDRSSVSSPTPLRPLLLTRPPSSRVMPLQSVTMVPLAQRRQRGGTISSNTRRPVIGLPQMYEEPEEGIFERPRAVPVLQQSRT